MSCQLKYIQEIAQKNSMFNDLGQDVINSIRPIKGYLFFFKRMVIRMINTSEHVFDNVKIGKSEIHNGDFIQVRSAEEINIILDDWRKHKGCSFMDDMYQYCGKSYRVLKEINFFFDEAKQKIVKCKNIVILDKVTCSGKRTLYKERCDRDCFLFWHKDWLNKIS